MEDEGGRRGSDGSGEEEGEWRRGGRKVERTRGWRRRRGGRKVEKDVMGGEDHMHTRYLHMYACTYSTHICT